MPLIEISENATDLEKLKDEAESYLRGLNWCGVIGYDHYCDAVDYFWELVEKAYELGKSERKEE